MPLVEHIHFVRPQASQQGRADYDGGTVLVDEVTVYSSQLGREGPIYEVLGRAPLSAEGRRLRQVQVAAREPRSSTE